MATVFILNVSGQHSIRTTDKMVSKKTILTVLILNVLLLGTILIFDLNYSIILLASFLWIPLVCIEYMIKRNSEMMINGKLAEKFIKKITGITEISSEGFKIIKNDEANQYLWKDIESIKFNKRFDALRIITRNKISLQIKNNTINWYELINSVPLGYQTFDYNYVKKFFSDLHTCEICGGISLYKDICLICGSEINNISQLKDHDSKQAYIKQEQLELFALTEKNEKFDGFYSPSGGFMIDPRWRPLISEKELIEYSKKEYWDA